MCDHTSGALPRPTRLSGSISSGISAGTARSSARARASALVDATLRELDCAPFVYRYEPGGDDGFDGREGAFLPASWWVVSALAACGRVEEAQERARALDRALPALMPEEMDPESRVGLGNVPLVWSHMEAARAMYLLDAAELRQRWTGLGLLAWRTSRWLRARGG